MNIFKMFRDYIAALQANAAATAALASAQAAALSHVRWSEYQAKRHHGHGHDHISHCHGNASVLGGV